MVYNEGGHGTQRGVLKILFTKCILSHPREKISAVQSVPFNGCERVLIVLFQICASTKRNQSIEQTHLISSLRDIQAGITLSSQLTIPGA